MKYLLSSLVVVVSAGLFSLPSEPAMLGTCGAGCERCERTESFNQQCNLAAVWFASDQERDGCCFVQNMCPDWRCLWSGTLEITNNGGQGNITIGGPGSDVVCNNVPNGGTCSKTFGGMAHPVIDAPCGDENRFLVEIERARFCTGVLHFVCSACTGKSDTPP